MVSDVCDILPRWGSGRQPKCTKLKKAADTNSHMSEEKFRDYDRLLERMLERIKTSSDIRPADRRAMLKFSNYCLAEGLSTARVDKYLTHLLNLSKRIRVPFRRAKKDDIIDLVCKIEANGYTDHTRHDYRVTIKKFFKWLRGGEDYPKEVKWLKTTIRNLSTKLPEELLSLEEVKRMIQAATHPRDKAFIAVLYDSGCRIGEIGTLRIKHVEFDDYGSRLIVNGKTGMRRIRLILATPYLAGWLDIHPRSEDSDAPLWVSLSKRYGYPMLKYLNMCQILTDVALKTGIKKRIHPHLFRHSRATELACRLTEAQLKAFFGWTQSSDQAATYVHLSGRDMDDTLLQIYGLKKETKEEMKNTLSPKTCPRCLHLNAATTRFCSRCGSAFDTPTAMEAERKREIWDERMAEFVSDPKVQALWKKKFATKNLQDVEA